MQTLELILTDVVLLWISQMVNGGKCLGIMRRELRINLLWGSQQFFGTGNIRQVSMHFTGKHRIIRHAINLGFLDFAIPVRAFDQTNHQAFLTAFCQIHHVIDHVEATLLISLNHKANAFPVGKARLKTQTL